MSGADPDERRAEARRWLAIAKQDITASTHCLSASPPLTAVAAYHCQQAAEKIAKGVLVEKGIDFPKTHDLATLGALLAVNAPSLASGMSELEHITVWASPIVIRSRKKPGRRRTLERLANASVAFEN